MKNILLLTDFSQNSLNAIYYALNLYEPDDCNYYLLHVQNSNSNNTDEILTAGNESLYDIFIKGAKDKLKGLVTEIKKKFQSPNLRIKPIVDYDVLTDAVNQMVHSSQIDLIVMGTNGVTGAKEVIFGSNTINVIRKVNYPTLVVPEDFKYEPPQELLLPLDLNDSIHGDAFKSVLKFTQRYGTKLHVVRLKPDAEEDDTAQKDQADLKRSITDFNFEYHVVSGIPMSHAVETYLQVHKINFMMLVVQKEHLFERFFMGSPTTKISNTLRVPLLVFHS